MARLRINWRTAQSVAPQAAATGERVEGEEVKQASSFRAEKPILIFVTDDDPTKKGMRKLQDVVFANEQVGLGAKFFDCVKMTAGDAMQDRIVSNIGRHTPRLVFLRRDYTVQAKLEGSQISGGKVLKAMKAASKKEYVTSFDKMVRAYRKLLDELDRLDSKRSYIADQKARVAAKPNASKAKKIERDEQKLNAEMEEWNKKEQAVMELRTRADKKAEA